MHANPRIATVSGQNADIFVGRQKYLSQPVEMSGANYRSMNFIDAGIKLEMTPWTGGDGEIIADVHSEVSVMSAPDPVTGLPTLSSRTASTTVRVKDGETIVIGGLDQMQDYYTTHKIPILGDVPLIGGIFRSRSKSSVNTQLLVLITPRILTESGHLPAAEEAKVMGRMLAE